jgi:hypothetical protein
MYVSDATSMAGWIVAIAEMAQTGKVSTGLMFQSTWACQGSFPLATYCITKLNELNCGLSPVHELYQPSNHRLLVKLEPTFVIQDVAWLAQQVPTAEF